MAKEVPHKFTPKQVQSIRYARVRWKWNFARIAAQYPEFFDRSTTQAERVQLVELVIRGVLGAADDSMIEAPFPPSPNSPTKRDTAPRRCANGHLYHGEICFQCYIASLPKPDAEAQEVHR